MEFTPENKARFDEIVERYPVKRSALLPALHLLQKQEGWLSDEAIEYAAALFELTPAQVHDTASYYTMFRLRPEGRRHLEFCTNLSCALRGAHEILEVLRRELQVGEDEVTADGRCSYVHFECLGSCDTAPIVMVDDDYHENLTPAGVRRLLRELP